MAKKSSNSSSFRLKGVAQTVAQSEPTMAKYTEHRGNVFWFKRRAPKPLRAGTPLQLGSQFTSVGKNGYVRFSLRTSNAREAAVLARKYAHLLDEAAAARPVAPKAAPEGSQTTQDMPTPTAEQIRLAADTMHAVLLDADDEGNRGGAAYLLAEVDLQDADEETARKWFRHSDHEGEVREPDRYWLPAADFPSVSFSGQAKMLKQLMPAINQYLYFTSKTHAPEPTPDLLPFVDAFRRVLSDLEQRRKSQHVPTPPLPERRVESAFTLSVLYEKFKAYNIAQKAWKDPEVQDSREYGPVIREFIALVGDKSAHELTRGDAEKYFEHTMGRSDIKIGTKKRNFSRVRALLNYGRKKHSVPDIAGSLELEATYEKTHESYERFTGEELKALFHSEAYTRNTFRKASDYWLPLIGLYTGARIDEIASLLVANIVEIKGVWCYFLSSRDANNSGKNQYAPRWVPIHPELLKAGLLEHWQRVKAEGHQRLFPECGSAKRDGPGKRATVDFTDYRRSVGVGAMEGRSKKVFHSFRSTLISELVQRKTDDYTRQKILGHSISEGEKKFKGVHFDVYDQSHFDAKRAFKVISKANFGLTHPKFCDSPEMIAARARHLRKAQ